MSIRVYNKDAFEDLQQTALKNMRSPTSEKSKQLSGSGSCSGIYSFSSKNTSELSMATQQKRLLMKHKIYQREQEKIQQKVLGNISENLAKQRKKREANYMKMKSEIEEGQALADELIERLTLKEESTKRQKQRLFEEWNEKVYTKCNQPILEKVHAMDANELNKRKQATYQRFLDTANKKGCIFRDIIIESDYDPLHDHKYIKHRVIVDDPCRRVLKNRDDEEAIASEGRHVKEDCLEQYHDDGARDKSMSALGRSDNLDTRLWASGIFESTPYGYFNKMMESKISEEGAKTLHSHIQLDHYNIEKGSATLNKEFPKGKRTNIEGLSRLDQIRLG